MTYVLGIDAGGTKTLCLVADLDGHVVAHARAAGANLYSAGPAEVERLLRDVIQAGAGDQGAPPAAVCVGMAGVDRDTEIGAVQQMLARITGASRILVVNDALVALEAGAGNRPGIVVIAGTGSIAYGRNARQQAARSGGWGYILADEGSGYWIGRHMLRAVVREADGRGPRTALTPLIVRHFSLTSPADLIPEVHRRNLPPSDIAALTVYVQPAIDARDPVARAIIDRAAHELELSATAVARRLDMLDSTFPFVLAGSVFRHLPALESDLKERLSRAAPRASVELLGEEPAVGAVRLAIAEARGGAMIPPYLP